MPSPSAAKSNTKTPLLIFAAACLGLLLVLIDFSISALRDEYGVLNVNAAIVRFMEKENRWPRSWEEIEPHYTDMFFNLKTTRFIRQHYGVAWHVDPFELLKQTNNEPLSNDSIYDYEDGIVPTIYKLRKEKDITHTTTWILHPLTYHYLASKELDSPAAID